MGCDFELLPIVLPQPLNVSNVLKIGLIALMGEVAPVLLLRGLVHEHAGQRNHDVLLLVLAIQLRRLAGHAHLLRVGLVEGRGVLLLHRAAVVAALVAGRAGVVLDFLIFYVEDVHFFVDLITLQVPL